jgi:hypothetical protein
MTLGINVTSNDPVNGWEALDTKPVSKKPTYHYEIGDMVKLKNTKEILPIVDRFISYYGTDCYWLEGENNGTKYRFYLEWFCLELVEEPEENLRKELSSELH